MLLNDNQKKERTEMKRIRKDAKTLGLDFVDGYKGKVNFPRVNMNSIPSNLGGLKALDIELNDWISIKVYQHESGRVHVNIVESNLTRRESLSIETHERKTYSNNTKREFESTTLEAKGSKVDICFETFHEPLEK
mgnify:CR=1 FL=1|tara:strand:+ start:802 stop:1206 length:405 start_codon:yes stop_codon:yes gene_type:complete